MRSTIDHTVGVLATLIATFVVLFLGAALGAAFAIFMIYIGQYGGPK